MAKLPAFIILPDRSTATDAEGREITVTYNAFDFDADVLRTLHDNYEIAAKDRNILHPVEWALRRTWRAVEAQESGDRP